MVVVRCVAWVEHLAQGLKHAEHTCQGGNPFISTELNASLGESFNEKIGDEEGCSSRKGIIRVF